MKGLLQRLLGEHVQLNLELGAGNASVHADPGQIELVVMNLAVNAADAMPEGGQLTIRAEDAEVLESHVAEHADATPGRHVLLSVVDNGTGMTPDTEAHMFEPFFTTKPVGKGTGLGLATVYGTVQRLGGHIRVESEFGVGSTFSIYIPAVDAKEAAREPDLEPVHAATGETILVCEDQAPVRKLICLTLRAASYQVIEAGDGNQALAATAAHAGKIDMLISDVVMPGMSGAMLADRLTLEYPDMRVLLISGYSADHLSGDNIRDGTAEFLPKPFGPTALLRRTREVLEQPAG
jgi:CheY-like chemotaxis protein